MGSFTLIFTFTRVLFYQYANNLGSFTNWNSSVKACKDIFYKSCKTKSFYYEQCHIYDLFVILLRNKYLLHIESEDSIFIFFSFIIFLISDFFILQFARDVHSIWCTEKIWFDHLYFFMIIVPLYFYLRLCVDVGETICQYELGLQSVLFSFQHDPLYLLS